MYIKLGFKNNIFLSIQSSHDFFMVIMRLVQCSGIVCVCVKNLLCKNNYIFRIIISICKRRYTGF